MERRDVLALLGFGAAVAVVAVAGSFAAVESSQQYGELEQPSWAPPSWLFGPVWTTLYVMIALGGWLAWRAVGSLRDPAMVLYGVQLVMNGLWTPLFFAWELRGFALGWIIGLDLVVAATIWRFWRADRRASYLLMPYMAWIAFATALNASVWWLNR